MGDILVIHGITVMFAWVFALVRSNPTVLLFGFIIVFLAAVMAAHFAGDSNDFALFVVLSVMGYLVPDEQWKLFVLLAAIPIAMHACGRWITRRSV
jgi:hypothetical protein